jgi:hypothetical protein
MQQQKLDANLAACATADTAVRVARSWVIASPGLLLPLMVRQLLSKAIIYVATQTIGTLLQAGSTAKEWPFASHNS